nr:hypothetical protein [uncultured Fibrobacter sp.]
MRFEKKIWLSSPTMHGDEIKFMTEAYETNWMSTVGENIDAVEKIGIDFSKKAAPAVWCRGCLLFDIKFYA